MVSGRLRSLRGYLELSSANSQGLSIIQYVRNHWVKLALWLLVIIPLVPFVIGSLVMLIYMVWPINYAKLPALPSLEPERPLTILAHGLKSSPQDWSNALKLKIESSQPNAQVIALDWNHYAQQAFRCSVDGKRIGKIIAGKIITKNIDTIHLVGHSCGSFVVLGICEALREHDYPASIHTTYLDPVSVYAGLWWNYGVSHFGRCANFSDAYIDTRDQVPGSNQALEHAYTFDVSALSEQMDYRGRSHQWPVHYYLHHGAALPNVTQAQQRQTRQQYLKNVLYKKNSAIYNSNNKE